MACLYRHIRKDLNVPFYVGIGKNLNRAYSKSHRNNHWLSIVQKTEYDVHIVFDEIDYEFAKEKEKEQQFLQKTMNAQKLTLSQVRLDKAMVLKELEKEEKKEKL